MHPKITVKIVIEGDPEHVELVAEIAKNYFKVVTDSGPVEIPLRKDDVRRTLRIAAPEAEAGQ